MSVWTVLQHCLCSFESTLDARHRKNRGGKDDEETAILESFAARKRRHPARRRRYQLTARRRRSGRGTRLLSSQFILLSSAPRATIGQHQRNPPNRYFHKRTNSKRTNSTPCVTTMSLSGPVATPSGGTSSPARWVTVRSLAAAQQALSPPTATQESATAQPASPAVVSVRRLVAARMLR